MQTRAVSRKAKRNGRRTLHWKMDEKSIKKKRNKSRKKKYKKLAKFCFILVKGESNCVHCKQQQ